MRIAFGFDFGYIYPGKTRGQAALTVLQAYCEAGMTPLDAIRAATIEAAALLGQSDRIGSLEVGRQADIAAVAGDPLRDIDALQQIEWVMLNGRVVKSPTP